MPCWFGKNSTSAALFRQYLEAVVLPLPPEEKEFAADVIDTTGWLVDCHFTSLR
jgi:hypothetical protein